MTEPRILEQNEGSSSGGKRRGVGLLRWAIGLIILFLLGMVLLSIQLGVVRFDQVTSESMEPTLMKDDRLLTFKYRNEPIERGEIVLIRAQSDDGYALIKRVVAVPGDTIEIRRGLLFINGEHAPSPTGSYWIHWPPFVFDGTLERDEYMVLGDNRENSYDSRDFGFISKKDVIGLPEYIYAPAGRRGSVDEL